MSEINELKVKLQKFVADRNWAQFHTPKNLCMALASEIGELSDIFQWLTDAQSFIDSESKAYNNVKEELADIFIYLLLISDKLNIDLVKSAFDKIEVNAKKYPIGLSKNNAKKYTELKHEATIVKIT